MATYQLDNLNARLVFIALQYHLARPGAELDPETKQPVRGGLADVARALEPQLEVAVATIELSDAQRQRLDVALAGAISVLKSAPIMGGRAGVPAFDAAMRRLFPDAAGDPDEAAQLAAHLIPLRRRLATSRVPPAPESTEQRGRRRGWRIWKRS